MSATEELRAMLDERGVEWWETTDFIGATITDEGIERHYLVSTWWVSPLFGKVEAADMGDGVLHMACLNGCDLTPEQAIDATLGRGECHNEGDQKDFLCSECGARMFIDTGETYTMIDSLGNIIEHPSFCPNCGRKVVDE